MTSNQPVPVTISVMLACYYSPDPMTAVGFTFWHSKAGTNARAWLFENDLITEDHRATKRGMAWIERLLDTPLPASSLTTKGVRIRYAYASKPTVFHFVKSGPRTHRRWMSRDEAQAYISDRKMRGGPIEANAAWEIVE